MKKRLTSMLLICMMLDISAQQNIPINIPTPNAASLGKYGDIPVSYYTGNPNITIPLHTFSVRGVEMPISLRYDASGVQMNVLPTWTGHNWTLDVGGVITRQINCRPDEFIPSTQLSDQLTFGLHNYFDYYNKVNRYAYTSNNDSELEEITMTGSYDMEPDIFTFSVMGKTGRFFLGNDGEWKVDSEYNLDIIFDVANYRSHLLSPFVENYPKQTAIDKKQPKTIEGFKIIDENGTIYEFGFTQDAIEYTIPLAYCGDQEDINSLYARSWYLTRVLDRFGNELYKLTYHRGYFFWQVFNIAGAEGYEQNATFNGVFLDFLLIPFPVNNYGSSFNSTDYSNPYSFELNAPVYLHKIETLSGLTAEFTLCPNPVGLDEMYSVLYQTWQLGKQNMYYSMW